MTEFGGLFSLTEPFKVLFVKAGMKTASKAWRQDTFDVSAKCPAANCVGSLVMKRTTASGATLQSQEVRPEAAKDKAEAAKDTTPSPPATPSVFPVSTAPGKGDTTNGSAEVNASSKTASNRQEDRPTGQGQSTDVKPMQAAPKDTGTAVPEFMIREDWAGTNEDGQRLPDQRLKWIPVRQRNFLYDPKTRVPPEARRQKDFP
ncbi:hypothetical protein HPB47_005127 [Ixodes persulcatus]|uniref:Uncharacterized protein n=1 Tax=Ixodes persulcatus TaxID=34615 RepID=A0AC60PDS9_IXOPE|nr:hypothetical protein HPB47_005127 [Ixodes persulcatus]